MSSEYEREEVAIVGMAGRFPGARNVEEFWSNLRDGVESIRPLTDAELDSAGVRPETRADPDFVNAGSVMDDADGFDAAFFGMSRREAELTDPQHRVFLECAWEAIEHAGYNPRGYDGRVGVFGGVAANTYFQQNLVVDRALMERTGDYPLLLASEREYAITRVAYKLGLKGPALSVNTACSTSAVAVHLACQSLLSGESDMALAGGARIRVPLTAGYVYQEDGILSPDGHCRAFDADARGTVAASGAAVITLKRLSDAIDHGDTVYAIIKGTAINNDGDAKIGFTAPGVQGQVAVIREALAVAEVSADTIGMVEAHGTGTSLGDPIEVTALTQAFGPETDRRQYCAIGSLKTNIGHLDAGAGVAGIIKAALALHHEQIPPSLNFSSPNPQINFADSPFFVNASLREWKRNSSLRRAGVSSFGLGGTNAHVILEEGPLPESPSTDNRPQILTISARSQTAVSQIAVNLADHLVTHRPELADVAHTLQAGRRHFEHRHSMVAATLEEAVESLRRAAAKPTSRRRFDTPPVAFLFPGGGSQHVGMAAHIYQTEPAFRHALDQCCDSLHDQTGLDLGGILYPRTELNAAEDRLQRVSIALPALFSVEYALAQLWLSWGVRPTAMIGHSLGEYVAATVAGVFSLEAGIGVVAERGRLMENAPRGAMLSVALPADEVTPYLDENVSLAVVNTAENSVLSGKLEAIEALTDRLASEGVEARRIPISVASHSVLMEPVLAGFDQYLRTVRMERPQIPFVSNVTGTWVTGDQATSPEYWTSHLRGTVRFADGVGCLLIDEGRLLVEVGPGQTLTSLVRQHSDFGPSHEVIPSLPHPKQDIADDRFFLEAVGMAWRAGASVDWASKRTAQLPRRIALPGYPFEHERYWIEPTQPATQTAPQVVERAVGSPHPSHAAPKADIATEPHSPSIAGETQVVDRRTRIQNEVVDVLSDLSGLEPADIDQSVTFLDLGFDSLFLTQANSQFAGRFGVKITFRVLFEEAPTVEALSAYIDERMEPDVEPPPLQPAQPEGVEIEESLAIPMPGSGDSSQDRLPQRLTADGALERVINSQLEIMREQLAAITGVGPQPDADSESSSRREAAELKESTQQAARSSRPEVASETAGSSTGFGPWKPAETRRGRELSPAQQTHIDDLVDRFTTRTKKSKEWVQAHRQVLADPRTASGFARRWKELVYPIVSERSAGSKLWDLDGNQWLDVTSGFGVILFGHSPPFLTDAIVEQATNTIAIGPQTPHSGAVAELISEFTGMERVAFCNTGSEAVLAALRMARTVTGRDKIVMFSGDYHGIFDEVLVKGSAGGRPLPVAAGITRASVGNTVVLDYGSPESLEMIEQNADELAAVVVEPVQSRILKIPSSEYLQRLRELTSKLGIALIFDEIITGFRVHPQGAQGLFDIRADIATYGKVIGAGLPIGVVAGSAEFLDSLDGGSWEFGDDSVPEVGVTWFAGTFVRHPLAMAAAKASLQHLQERGSTFYQGLNARTERIASELNDFYIGHRLPIRIEHFASLFRIEFEGSQEFASLYWHHLRDQGIHCHEGRTNFLTDAHSDADVEFLVEAFKASALVMQKDGFFPAPVADPTSQALDVAPAVEPAGRSNDAQPLTEGQEEIWLASQLGPEASAAFNISSVVRLDGPLDHEALRGAIHRLVQQHDALRTTFEPTGGHSRVGSGADIALPVMDLSGMDGQHREQMIATMMTEEVSEPFDLESGPAIRFRLLQEDERHHQLIITAHHVVCDGWSMGVLHRRLGELYSESVDHSDAPSWKLPSFREYAAWEDSQRKSHEAKAAELYWSTLYATEPPPLEFPTDRPRPPVKTFRCAQASWEVDPKLVTQVRRFASERGMTLFATMTAVYAVLLQRLAGQTDIALGVFASGQLSYGERDLVGHCVNLLPIRVEVAEEQPLNDYLSSFSSSLWDAYDNQSITMGGLLKTLNVTRDPSRFPLVSTSVTLESPTVGVEFSGLDVSVETNSPRFSTYDLEVYFYEQPGGLKVDFQFNTDLFDRRTVVEWLEHYESLVRTMVGNDYSDLIDLPVHSERQADVLLGAQDGMAVDYPDELMHEAFEARAIANPDGIAVRGSSGAHMTYGELNAMANRIAKYLWSHGAGPGTLVGVHLRRSAELVATLLAVHKAGAAYVPLDPSFPAERLEYMIKDAGIQLLATELDLLNDVDFPEHQIFCLDRDWPAIAEGQDSTPIPGLAGPDDLAYLIYTSGSTGMPKGVMIPHKALTNFLHAMEANPGIKSTDCLLAITTISFDIAALEIFLPLVSGASVLITTEAEGLDMTKLADLISDPQVSLMQATPATWKLLVDSGWSGKPELTALCGGEAMSRDLADALLARVATLHNMYGPTETTIWSAVREVVAGSSPPPIGRPIANTTFFVLDGYLRPVPTRSVGELFIGGMGVADGYLNRADLSSERFVQSPFDDDPRSVLYRTGDLVRYTREGNLEFIGRSDNQVKLRGFRIELGEIEARLRQHPKIKDAVVTLNQDGPGGDRLAAYVVPLEQGFGTVSELRAFLREFMPEYMVPSTFTILDRFPLTPNKKIDKAKLPSPDHDRPALTSEYVAPVTHNEEVLAEIWKGLLQLDQIGTHDNFFDLGGDSLLGIRAIMKAGEAGITLRMTSIFEHQTIAELSEAADRTDHVSLSHQGVVTGPTPLTPAQLRFLYERNSLDPHHWNLSALVQATELDPECLATALSAVLNHHDALRLRLAEVGGIWQQEIADGTELPPLVIHDLTDLPHAERVALIETECASLQGSLDLAAGPILRVAHFRCGPSEPDRLLVTIHHFAVDGMSWPVFWEDFESAYRQALAGTEIALPRKTTSVRDWAIHLDQLVKTPRVSETIPAWLELPWDEADSLPSDHSFHPDENTNASAEIVEVIFTADETDALLRGRGVRSPEQVLIASLAVAVGELNQSNTIRIDTLSHGRDAALETIDLSRTLGFTISYNPLVLRLPMADSPAETLESVAEQLRATPEGFTFDLLRFLAPDVEVRKRLAQLPRSTILFNYEGPPLPDQTESLFEPAKESRGPAESPKGRRQYPLAVRTIFEDTLRVRFVFSNGLNDRATIEGVARSLSNSVRSMLKL